MRWVILSLLVASSASANEYLDAVKKLPAEYTEGGCHPGAPVPDDIQRAKDMLVSRYAWAIPSDEAIREIAEFAPHIVEIGAGSGYWANELHKAGATVAAYDNWSWGLPAKMWYRVGTADESILGPWDGASLMLVWPPRPEPGFPGGDMAENALRIWHGDRLIYVGEVMRGNANPAFFEALARDFHLVKRIEIPSWWNRSDEVYLLERGNPDGGAWIGKEMAACVL